jgi:hypothetical protein
MHPSTGCAALPRSAPIGPVARVELCGATVLLPILGMRFWPYAHWALTHAFLALEENSKHNPQGWHSTMKRIALLKARQAASAPTGTHCPASGSWIPDGAPQEAHTFFEGQVLPAYLGEPTMWRRLPGAKDS